MTINIQTALSQAAQSLTQVDEPKLEAEVLLAHVLGKSRTYLFTWPEQELSKEQTELFHSLVDRRSNGEPIAYITGVREFWSLELQVTPDVLIPRAETEVLVELVLKKGRQCHKFFQQMVHRSDERLRFILPSESSGAFSAPQPQDDERLKIADLGTGSAAIACAIASERPTWKILAIDASEGALKVAQANATHHNLNNITCQLGNWCDGLAENSLDIIVSNPPYIESDDQHLQQGDVRFEPPEALASGSDGLDDIRVIAKQAKMVLKAGGLIALEHGYNQAKPVAEILQDNGFLEIQHQQDLLGHDRVTFAVKA